jgi:cell division protein FtsL
VEKRAQATPGRVERIAREQLHMRPATPAITQYVTLKGAP